MLRVGEASGPVGARSGRRWLIGFGSFEHTFIVYFGPFGRAWRHIVTRTMDFCAAEVVPCTMGHGPYGVGVGVGVAGNIKIKVRSQSQSSQAALSWTRGQVRAGGAGRHSRHCCNTHCTLRGLRLPMSHEIMRGVVDVLRSGRPSPNVSLYHVCAKRDRCAGNRFNVVPCP